MPHANYQKIAKNYSVDMSNWLWEIIKILPVNTGLCFIFILFKMDRQGNVTWLGTEVYLESTDNVADDFYNGLLKLSKLIDQAQVYI